MPRARGLLTQPALATPDVVLTCTRCFEDVGLHLVLVDPPDPATFECGTCRLARAAIPPLEEVSQ